MFTQEAFTFLADLAKNNNRDWFNENKQRYEDCVRTPTLKYIEAMAKVLPQLSTEFTAIAKKVGGSMMRPYRDIRFSKDKTPYKTNIGIQFKHKLAKNVHAPGIYLHITNDESFYGIGIWRPESKVLKRIRSYITDNPNYWVGVRDGIHNQSSFNIVGDKLKRPPQGFDKDHPLVEDLKHKDFIISKQVSTNEILSTDFSEKSISTILQGKDYLEWLCDAIEIRF